MVQRGDRHATRLVSRACKHAALRVPEGWEGGSEAYRVLLEPRLPAHAIRDIILSLDGFGLTLNHAALDVRGNLPASLTVETTLPTLPVQTLYIPGLLWVEPVLPTYARNGQASSSLNTALCPGTRFGTSDSTAQAWWWGWRTAALMPTMPVFETQRPLPLSMLRQTQRILPLASLVPTIEKSVC